MENLTTISYPTGPDQPYPSRIESGLEEIYKKHNLPPVTAETRKRLSSIPEQLASDTLTTVYKAKQIRSLDGYIKILIDQSSTKSLPNTSTHYSTPCPNSSKRHSNDGRSTYYSLHSPQLIALGQLEFKKAFLLLSYIPGQSLDKVINADEIIQWKGLSMTAYESAVWNRLGCYYCPQTDRKVSLEWDSGKTHYYQCHVASDGSYTFKGPLLQHTSAHLHKVLGDENVLEVKFADVKKSSQAYSNNNIREFATYKGIVKNGIMVGLRRYQFFVFKDGGKAEKKKDYCTNGVKCYFIRTDSRALIDMENPYIFTGKSINEARMHFMHVHTLPSLANYMARFSLIMSKTKTLDVDLNQITFEKIDDIRCQDENGKDVFDKDDKPCIHSDGTGYISEDLARMCPVNISKEKCLISEPHESSGQDPPLLIQFRMFYDGYAVKGTFLLNKKIPPRTVQVRPSMIKVSKDPKLLNFNTFNALEIVTTSNPPKRTKLPRNLVALLSYGGIPNEFFLNILRNTLEESKTVFYNKHAAIKVALNYGEMDDYTAATMIFSGIPLEEPYLKNQLSIFIKTEKNDLKAGKLPVSESYYLMGTVDPTNELKEDEVCVILEAGQISGDVLVYRNPGQHFGDIHILKATYVKALEGYVGNSKYGVFFPQQGSRSLGDEMASGDFDGDMYFISRNPELLKHFKQSKPWVSMSPPSKSNSSRKLPNQLSPEELEEELFDMFLKTRFQASNVIGIAADCWLTIMDRFLTLGDDKAEEKEEMEKKMVKLTDIYYDALDAPKKGVKVYLPNTLKPDIYPHYMERDRKFNSTSVLGLIYDLVKSHTETTVAPSPSSEIYKLQCFKDEPVSKSLIEKYTQWYGNYRGEMCEAMNTNGSDKSEVTERYKQDFYGAVGFEESKKSKEELYSEALALYNVVYDYAMKQGVSKCGFFWKVAGAALCELYIEKTHQRLFKGTVSMAKELWGLS